MSTRKLILLCISIFLVQQAFAQVSLVTVSGLIKNKANKQVIPYINIQIKKESDQSFVTGTLSNETGRFSISKLIPGNYILAISSVGFKKQEIPLFIGSLSEFLEIPTLELEEDPTVLQEIQVKVGTSTLSAALDKKTYQISDNLSQLGGSVLQSIQNLPGITVSDGKISLRGSDKIAILIDGKQTALTGFNSQSGLDNLAASGIDRIEIINNPSAKYDANGNAGIINIIMKKNLQEGFNGKVGFTTGLGSLWVRKENLPSIRPQYTLTPKINPSIALNYRKGKINWFLQADNLFTKTLNKNEFVNRNYDDGTVIQSQLKRNRNTNFLNAKTGLDWSINDQNNLTISGMFGSEKILDHGDQPFFNADLSQRLRLWQFLEDELKTTIMASANYQHKFNEAGHLLNMGFNYTYHRENEKYFYDNYLPNSQGTDAFKLLSDEQVYDFNVDYIKPLRYGRLETGVKFRKRYIPTNMIFIPGANSVLDMQAGGWANYDEIIPAIYGNYVFETKNWEAELGLRLEYVKINYDVNPDHKTYKSDGYHYAQPFPNIRVSYKFNETNKLSLMYNRRVDRPNEVDIRIFPKYDDAEIIKVGNPGLRPQFTNSIDLGFKNNWQSGYFYTALYHRFANATISRISTIEPGSTLIYAVAQNIGKSYNSGIELIWNQKFTAFYTLNINGNLYRNQIDAFNITNKYPTESVFHADEEKIISGSVKMNNTFHFRKNWDVQLLATYLAPDLIPQGKMKSRFSVDLGCKKTIQKGKGEVFLNATDLFNTMSIRKNIISNGFHYSSNDYYETQVVRIGYNYKF